MQSFIFTARDQGRQTDRRSIDRVARAMDHQRSIAAPEIPAYPMPGQPPQQTAPQPSLGGMFQNASGALGGAMAGGAAAGPIGAVVGGLAGAGLQYLNRPKNPSAGASAAMGAGWDGFSAQPASPPQSAPAYTQATGNKSIGTGATQTNGTALDFTAAFRKLFG